ncbi:condensation domain-containing protein [Paenibacillus sp. NPDC057934]|uniref:condensation domain-containing protein n=1 Tax=Paenibacillus sp. NPDC057934 TaxID=3346282 RepID=UPI0036DEC0CC
MSIFRQNLKHSCDVMERESNGSIVNDIAIIGMSGLFPLASTPDHFWNNLIAGVDGIGTLPVNRKEDLQRYLQFIGARELTDSDGISNGYLEEIDKFDHNFFHLSHEEACLMEPVQRLFLQVVWHALEDASYGGDRLFGSNTGVFYGESDQEEIQYKQIAGKILPESRSETLLGNRSAFIPGRISYLMDWNGPSMVINTSGSSSLVALHQACQSIRAGECEQAVVGSGYVKVFPTPRSVGHNRYGEGVFALLIKPYSRAVADGDHIHATIKGSAVCQSGRTAGTSYQDLFLQAWSNAGIHPNTLSFIETDRLSSLQQDSPEWGSLLEAASRYEGVKPGCALSALPSHIGALSHASGLAEIIKSILVLKHRVLPPAPTGPEQASNIASDDSPFFVSDQQITFPKNDQPLRCGVSSFGANGTNCHMVLEEATLAMEGTSPTSAEMIFTLSARTETALQEMVVRYTKWISYNKDFRIQDVCYSTNTGRGHYAYRLAMVVSSLRELQDLLEALSQGDWQNLSQRGIYYGRTGNQQAFVSQSNLDLMIYTQANDQEDRNERFELCRAYVQGTEVDWSLLYGQPSNYQKVPLPGYAFEKIRCWIEPLEKIHAAEESKEPATLSSEMSVEAVVMKYFQTYLGFTNVNESANFYELGGDSITAIKIVKDVNRKLHTECKEIDLLKHPSVMEFSEFLKQVLNESSAVVHGIPKAENKAYYPLSSAQSRIFIMSQYNPDFTMYNTPVALILEGWVDPVRLQNALNKVIGRHESLRTSFGMVDADPVQTIHEDLTIQMAYHDFPIEERQLDEELREFTRPFQLGQAPLMRCSLYKLTNQHHAFLFDIHHIISDGTSLLNLLNELFLYYEGDVEPDPLSIQYKDFAEWQSQFRRSDRMEELKRFWMTKLSGKLPELNLPTDFPRPATKTYVGDQIRFVLDTHLKDALYRFSQETGVTMYVLLLAFYHLLLVKITGEDDIIVGSIAQGRPLSMLDPVIGMFVHTIVLRNKFGKNDTFLEFLKRVQESTLQAFEHQEYPFEDLVALVNQKRDPSRNPLFDTAFIMHNMYKQAIHGNSIRVRKFPYHNGVSLVDMALEIHETSDELIFHWEFSTSLFRKETIVAFGEKLTALIEQILRNPDDPLDQIEGMSPTNDCVEEVEFQF